MTLKRKKARVISSENTGSKQGLVEEPRRNFEQVAKDVLELTRSYFTDFGIQEYKAGQEQKDRLRESLGEEPDFSRGDHRFAATLVVMDDPLHNRRSNIIDKLFCKRALEILDDGTWEPELNEDFLKDVKSWVDNSPDTECVPCGDGCWQIFIELVKKVRIDAPSETHALDALSQILEVLVELDASDEYISATFFSVNRLEDVDLDLLSDILLHWQCLMESSDYSGEVPVEWIVEYASEGEIMHELFNQKLNDSESEDPEKQEKARAWLDAMDVRDSDVERFRED